MGLRLLPFRFPGIPGVGCAFQMAGHAAEPHGAGEKEAFSAPCFSPAARGNISLEAGVSGAGDEERVVANREKLRDMLGLRGLAEVRQVHGVVTLFEPEAADLRRRPENGADGLAASRESGREGIGLMIKTADCQPILVAHKGGNHVMALHAGWKGNRQDYPRLAVEEFCARYRLPPRELSAVRGPSLGPGRAEFTRFWEEWGEEFTAFFDAQTRCMDLWRLTREQLHRAGIPQDRIYGLDLCTRSLADDFFSYRADRRCGRQASLIWLEGTGTDQTINI